MLDVITKLAFGVVVLTAFSVSISAQELTPAQRREFTQKQLTVEAPTEKTWRGNLGFNRVSEPEFYRIAGFPAEAERARQYLRGGVIWTWIGGVIYLGGLGLMSTSDSSGGAVEQFYWGIGIGMALVSAVPLVSARTLVGGNPGLC